MSFESRLTELDLVLPAAPPPAGTYSPVVVIDNMAYVSGQGPITPEGRWLQGRIGDEITEEEGVAAARQVALTMLATLKAELGTLDRIHRMVKVLGMVNCVSGFKNQPIVINGFSDLMVELFGDQGRAARSAVGMGSLPGNIPVEVEAIFKLNG